MDSWGQVALNLGTEVGGPLFAPVSALSPPSSSSMGAMGPVHPPTSASLPASASVSHFNPEMGHAVETQTLWKGDHLGLPGERASGYHLAHLSLPGPDSPHSTLQALFVPPA